MLQGIDTAGKDGTIRHVFKEASPLGVNVTAFRKPSEEEMAHDFLWRAHVAAPRRGCIGIFNRSYYEDVLVVRVRKLAPDDKIEKRYDQINAFEKILTENGTQILKFMLHISKKEQKERLQARLDEAESRWKFNPDDLEDRKLWDKFMAAYELALDKCSTDWAPWHIIPADRKWARNAAIAAIVRETLEEIIRNTPNLPGTQKLRRQMTRKRTVTVNDRMQSGYRYELTAPAGRGFDPEFQPELEAGGDARLGVFCGKYMTDCRKEFPASWFEQREACAARPRLLAQLLRRRRQPAAVGLAPKGLAARGRSARLVPVVLPLLHGPPHPDEDRRQIKRWKAIRRHVRQVQKNCEPGDLSCRPRQRQALLHWAYDSRKI